MLTCSVKVAFLGEKRGGFFSRCILKCNPTLHTPTLHRQGSYIWHADSSMYHSTMKTASLLLCLPHQCRLVAPYSCGSFSHWHGSCLRHARYVEVNYIEGLCTLLSVSRHARSPTPRLPAHQPTSMPS